MINQIFEIKIILNEIDTIQSLKVDLVLIILVMKTHKPIGNLKQNYQHYIKLLCFEYQ